MAAEETGEKLNQVKLSSFPDHIANYVEFKREMVRLDYTAEQLRQAVKEVEDKRTQLKLGLKRQEEEVTRRTLECHQKLLNDEQETLDLQERARLISDQKRVLQSELQTSRLLYEELVRKRIKIQHWLSGLEEHRQFLSEIIAHKVSPRTPRSSRSHQNTFRAEDHNVADIMHSPRMIKMRLAHKERNVIAQSKMIFQACQLLDTKSPEDGSKIDGSVEIYEGQHDSMPSWEIPCMRTQGLQTGLDDQIYAGIHRLYQRFISPKSSSCDALGNFAAIERYAYYVLQMVDACEPAMLKKIITKVVKDKKKTMEQEKIEREAAHRAERERKALANATSAPAQFRRVTVVGRKRLRRAAHSSHSREKTSAVTHEEVDAAPTDELPYLFRLQLN